MKKILKLMVVSLFLSLFIFLSSCNNIVNDNSTINTIINDESKEKNGKNIYFAAPLFSESERDFNLEMTNLIESYGYKIFLPQRDGYLASELEGLTEEEKTTKIFNKDYQEVLNADILIINLDGRVPDEGACVELGIAYANNKRCYGIKTDSRSIELGMDINPMITGCLTKLFYNLDGKELINDLKAYLESNTL